MLRTAWHGVKKGLNPNRCSVHYDEENKVWKHAFPKLAAESEGHDYQAKTGTVTYYFC